MASNQTPDTVLEQLMSQARQIWGEEDAGRQRIELQQTAEQIIAIDAFSIAPDLEPRFF